jgi:D-alanine-D-alanine ligase
MSIVAVIHGGRSGEHEVSLVSARTIMDGLAAGGHAVLPVLIGKDGRWSVNGEERRIVPDAQGGRLVRTDGSPAERFDIAMPYVHGTDGEDGALQGLLELVNVPYVGCGVAASAVGMDKVLQKRVLRDAGIPVAAWTDFRAEAWAADPEAVLDRVERELAYPAFVKPVTLGSSVGISKARDRAQLREAIALALRFDTRVIVEKAVPEAREIECAALGDGEHAISVFGEIFPNSEFYDYAAKYLNGTSTNAIPADIGAPLEARLRDMARATCAVLGVHGLARVDFLVSRTTGEAVLNEINTLPGFTAISMYPKLWEASGLPMPALLDHLLALAVARHRDRAALQRDFSAFLAKAPGV